MALQQLEPMYEGTVEIYGGAGPEGEKHRNVRITTLSRTASMMVLDEKKNRGVTFDKLENVVVDREPDGKLSFVGISQQLTGELGLNPANASVTWKLTPRGCKSCH